MKTDEQAKQGHQGPVTGKSNRAKKAYEKPAFRHEPVFETMALACGKINPTQGGCRLNRKRS
jgi:hypothetical protein